MVVTKRTLLLILTNVTMVTLTRCNTDTCTLNKKSASIEEFPYMVSLHYNGFICGGSLIALDKVLTSAKCVSDRVPYTVRAGSNMANNYGVTRKVTEIYIPPKYLSPDKAYDVAVLTLNEPFQSSKTISTIELSSNGTTFHVGTLGNRIVWDGLYGRRRLKSDEVEIISTDVCKYLFKSANHTMCFQQSDNRQGFFEQGSPLIVEGVQVGLELETFETKYHQENTPSMYTNVAHEDIYEYIQMCL